jgi:hypothetical protein
MSSSSTSKKIIYKNEVVTYVKDISIKMENIVSDLNILLESIAEMNNEFTINDSGDEYTLLCPNKDLHDSDKVLISKDELQQIKHENLRLKEDLINFKSEIGNIINNSVKEEIQNQYPQFQLDCSIC